LTFSNILNIFDASSHGRLAACPIQQIKGLQAMLHTISRTFRAATMSGFTAFFAFGMLASPAQADVGIYGADYAQFLADVVSKVQTASAGSLGAVSGHRLCTGELPCEFTPNLSQLQAYAAVLVYSDHSFYQRDALGDVLADYVDAGGTVTLVSNGFSDLTTFAIGGRFLTGGYMPVSQGAFLFGGTPLALVPVLPSHPILQGVNTFNGGSSSLRNLVSLAPGATLVATWNDAANTPLIAVKGRVVALNFFPASSTARADFWDASTDGGRIMANALRWGFGINVVTLPAGQVGSIYPATALSATGGTGSLNWSATGLPTGMSLSSSGEFTGTPTQHGSFSVQVTVTDSSATPLTRTVTLPLTINPPPLALSTTSLASATIGTPYTQTIAATGGVAPYAWSATGLPADLTINPTTGTISGTPTAAGTSQITVTVTDDAGQVKSAQFTIVVDPLDLTVTTQTLPGGHVGQAYSASIVVAGGVAPYSFTLTGDLPEGLTLNTTTGTITGTPTKAQARTFSVTIEDSTLLPQSAMAKAAVHSVTQSFSITVAAAPVAAAPTPVPTLNDWGLLLLSTLTIGVAGFFTRKRTTE